VRRYKSFGSVTFDVLNVCFLVVLCIIFVYPVYLTLLFSVSESSKMLTANKISFLPNGFTLESYKYLIRDRNILRYYWNTIVYASLGTTIMLLLTSMMAYPLSLPKYSGKKLVIVLLTITMFFGGGLIPYYIIIRMLGMRDTLWVMIVPGAISAWNVIIFRTFFQNIPSSLRESAMIDGASPFRILFRIIVPLSKPLLATFALFSIVGYWNDFFTAMLFLNDNEKYPIQMLLRQMLVNLDMTDLSNALYQSEFMRRRVNMRTSNAAAVIITITPIMCVYPFLQKYFAKGVMIGSIKG